MAEDVQKTRKFFRQWLEKLQQESWQLELLISGLALYGIWESGTLLNWFDDYLDLNATGFLSRYLRYLFLFLRISWSIFFFNLLAHIFLRGLWIGAIGLRYVSGEITYDELNYSNRFDQFLKKNVGDFDDYIHRLEKISSVLFSFTFLLLFFFLSMLMMLVFLGIYFQVIDAFVDKGKEAYYGFGFLFFLLFASIVFIDFISFGALKKIKEPIISKIYFWIYRFFGLITLSFLYRPLLYNFIDDRYTRRLVLISIPYIFVVSVLVPSMGFNAYNFIPSFNPNQNYSTTIAANSLHYLYYDDLREKYARSNYDKERNPIIHRASLDLYEYKDQALASIFFKARKDEEELMKIKHPELQAFSKKGFFSMFNSPDLKNEIIAAIKKEEAAEVTFMRKVVRGKENKISAVRMEKYASKLDYYRQYSDKDYKWLRDSLNDVYLNRRINSYDEYIKKTISARLDGMEFQIDSINYKDSLDCAYFIHPNMGERGMLCYFPIKTLKTGKHKLKFTKEYIARDTIDTYEHIIPFIINK